MTVTPSTWSPRSWRDLTALQQPQWPDGAAVDAAVERLKASPPLVFAGEARALRDQLAKVIDGRAFLLQAGDCVESFNELSTMRIREKLKIMLQMSAVLTYGATLPVVKVGRIAGQFTKPRSEPFERIGDEEIPSFRGHMIHDDARTAEARIPDPRRMVEGYNQSASTLNLLRAFTKGGYADLTQVHLWNKDFVSSSPEGRRYDAARRRDRARARVHGGVRHRSRERTPAARGRRLHEPRGSAARLRGRADATGLDHGRLVRLLRAPALDRRAHAAARRRARRVLLRRAQPDRRQDRPHARRPPRSSSSPSGSTRCGCRAGSPTTRGWAPSTCANCCRRCSAPCATRGIRSLWACDPMHGERDPHGDRREDASLRRDHGRARGLLQRLLGGRACGPAACISSSPART